MNNNLTDKNESIDKLMFVLDSTDAAVVDNKIISTNNSDHSDNTQSIETCDDYGDELFPEFKNSSSTGI